MVPETPEQPAARDFQFTHEDFERVRRLARAHTGIVLSDTKESLVYARLSRRLRELELRCFSDYCQLVESGDPEELSAFVSAITTNVTRFFREPHHFELLERQLLPSLLECRPRGHRLRAWSAGCSTGEEPWSIAMVLAEFFRERPRWDVRLFATDLDEEVLVHARRGVYLAERIEELSAVRRRRWFLRGRERAEGLVCVTPELRRQVEFARLNLLEPWPRDSLYDVIFCRNVMIYFDRETQLELCERMTQVLAPGGVLFLGHSENAGQRVEGLRYLGKTAYRREP